MSAVVPSRNSISMPGWRRLNSARSAGRSSGPAGSRGADRDRPAGEPAKLVDLAAQAVGLGQRRACARDRYTACGGELDGACGALEELHAQLLLKPADLMRHRGLGDVELVCSTREVPLAGDRLEIPELAQLHARLSVNTINPFATLCCEDQFGTARFAPC